MVRQIKRIHRLWSKDLEQFYQSHQTTRRDYWNLIGYEAEWVKNPLNVDFLNIKSPHFYIKKIQSQLYLKKLEPFLFKKMDILDFGGGIGRMIAPLANNFKTYTIVETSKLQIEQAYLRFKSYENVEFYNQELEFFDTNKKFDLILCIELLSYIENPNRALSLLKKYLKPQGYILISVENINTAPIYYKNSKQKKSQDSYFPYTYTKENSYFVRPQNLT